MSEPKVGEYWGRGRFRKKIRDVIKLSNGWYVIKTDNSKSTNDFKVKVIFRIEPSKSMTPKHAHFAIDLYGKLCYDREKGLKVMRAIYAIWSRENIKQVLLTYEHETRGLPGYPLEYILHAMSWILDQEDINFKTRPAKKQDDLNNICQKQNMSLLSSRLGSHLAISVLCDICNGTHPVEALLKGNLDVIPRKYGKK